MNTLDTNWTPQDTVDFTTIHIIRREKRHAMKIKVLRQHLPHQQKQSAGPLYRQMNHECWQALLLTSHQLLPWKFPSLSNPRSKMPATNPPINGSHVLHIAKDAGAAVEIAQDTVDTEKSPRTALI